ncbi:Acyl-coenzyme A thioesterase 13 [Quillaja saponaria]|uniref:Acyl-coenzyme A thioesterase 13 n=1 Tax=Quillaja saponaria TaxID=32244 RepID=A0AAD7PEE6_QUISA|nr:Acyl-coenzyme A thioesterase 13 [Quillaja saponaria]
MEDPNVQESLKWLRDLSNGKLGKEVDALSAKGLQVVEVQKGFIRCRFIIHNRICDEHGNWHVGAIAMLVDNIVGPAVFTVTGCGSVSVDYSISYYSKAKIQEEVEIEAKVVGEKERLTSVFVEVRKKETGELVALGKEWTTSSKANVMNARL